MWAVTALYAVLAFYNLGNTSAPQTFTDVKNGDDIVVDLGERRDITRITLYVGIAEGSFTFKVSDNGSVWRDITMSYREDGGEEGEENRAAIKPDHTTSFSWLTSRIHQNTRYIRITGSADASRQTVGMLGEVAVWDGDMQAPIVWTDRPEIADEQNLVARSGNYMNSAYFDEIYHARAAYEIIHGKPVYETVQPPLGKLLITPGIRIFGMTPFGWRFMGTLFGVAMLPVMFCLAKKTLVDSWLALVATSILALDFMHFTLTRISTIDSYPVFFIMLTFLFLLEYMKRAGNEELSNWQRVKPLLWSGFFFGLGCASKWITLYAAAGILALLIITWVKVTRGARRLQKPRKRGASSPRVSKNTGAMPATRRDLKSNRVLHDFLVCCGIFVVIPAIIYTLSYIPHSHDGNLFKTVVDSQKSMFSYHSKLDEGHPFASPAWTWPLVWKPVWAYMDVEAGAYGMTGAINIMGTPIIWWFGFAAALATIVLACVNRNSVAVFISMAFLTQYIFWFSIPRIIFIYHFFASVPFMILAMCFWLQKTPKWIWMATIAAAAVLFAAFYPLLAGNRIPIEYAEKLRWLPEWNIFAGR